MSRKFVPASLCTVLLGSATMADVPDVAVDIAPVHSLVAQVMTGVGAPKLIVPSGASPHEYNLRPSDAAALQEAELVFWMGDDLSPWLHDAIETLAEDAVVTTLLEADETILLEFRENALFEAHDHDEHDDHDDHAEDHDDHGHDEDEHAHEDEHGHSDDHHDAEAGHDDHDHATEGDEHDEHDDHEHAHGSHDPHGWLSPDNARAWLNLIAARLSSVDPENAGAYFANAAAARENLSVLSDEVNGILDPHRGGRFIVFHDAYQYFEVAFDFPASGAISFGDASDPGPARIAEIQDRIRDEGIDCVLAEPQFNPGLVATVLEGADAKTGVIDPLGSDIEPGPELYSQLILNLATSLAECL